MNYLTKFKPILGKKKVRVDILQPCPLFFKKMLSKGKRFLLPKQHRGAHAFNGQKITKAGSKLVIERLEKCLQVILSTIQDIQPPNRNLSDNILRAALNMLCINSETIQRAKDGKTCQKLVRQNAVYFYMKKYFPKVGVCTSTTKLLTVFLDCLAEDLVAASKLEAKKGRRSMLTERDVQIATLYVENVCILLKGCNDAAYIPTL